MSTKETSLKIEAAYILSEWLICFSQYKCLEISHSATGIFLVYHFYGGIRNDGQMK
jgi:hypothetical protein